MVIDVQYILPEKAIITLESEVIYPNLSIHPTLAAIIKKDALEDDKSFLRAIRSGAKRYKVRLLEFEVKDEMDVANTIIGLRSQSDIDSIILLSDFGMAQRALGNMIPTLLDIDGANSNTRGMLLDTTSVVGYRLAPTAVVACLRYLESDNIDLAGKSIAIIGRSLRIGRPLNEILLQKDASTAIFHSKSKDVDLSPFDIVISSTGKPNIIDRSWWKGNFKTTHIIDVGYNVDDSGNICGDVDVNSLRGEDFKINPIKGGLGELTTTVLFAKLYDNALGRIPSSFNTKRGDNR